MSYRRRASPLHAAGAGAGCLYCLALALAALVLSNPIALGAVAVAVLGAGVFAGAGRQMRVALMLSVPLALSIAVINALVSRDGLTVILRLGDLPVLGNTQVTLEATAYGGILGMVRVRRRYSLSLRSLCRDPSFDLTPFDPIGAVIFDLDDHHRTAAIDQLGSHPAFEVEDAFDRRDVRTDDLRVCRVY